MPGLKVHHAHHGLPQLLHSVSLPGHAQAITYNKQLREQIDNLRRERLMFEAINSNLDKDLARIKRNIAGEGRRWRQQCLCRCTVAAVAGTAGDSREKQCHQLQAAWR